MNNINETILQYLKEQSCATICCTDALGIPYCFNCYYMFSNTGGLLHFKTSPDSYHYPLLEMNPVIAGTILPDKLSKLVVKGIQFQGEVLRPDHPLTTDAYSRYHKKFPMALALKGTVFTIRIDHMKMTDSNLGFGKKLTWERAAAMLEGAE